MLKKALFACGIILGIGADYGSAQPRYGQWSPARAWHAKAHRAQKPTLPSNESASKTLSLSGTIERVASNGIEVLVDPSAAQSGKQDDKHKDKSPPVGKWTVVAPRGTRIQVDGEATPDYLKAGLLVQVTSKVTEAGVTEPIHELTIVSKPSPTAQGSGPRSNSLLVGRTAAGNHPEASTVLGTLGRARENQWQIRVGEKNYPLQLAEDLKIKVALASVHLINAGDKIVVHGAPVPDKPGTCLANDIQVTMAQPLGAKKKGQP